MNEIQSSLFDTMKQFSNYTKDTSTSPVTFEGTIKEVKDAGTGIYIVEYLGNDIECYANNNMSYLVGDNVYVLVPNGDFSKNKIILGLIDTREKQNFSKIEDNIYYYPISDNLLRNNTTGLTNPIELSSYDTTNDTYDLFNTVATKSLFYNLVDSLFTEGHNTFSLSFFVKTKLASEQQNSGNYGLSIKIPLAMKTGGAGSAEKLIWKEYPLDVSNMLGNPYGFNDWSLQSTYFSIDSEQYTLADVSPQLNVYCYGFSQDTTKHEVYDIFIKDYSLIAVDPLVISEEGDLGITLKVTEGVYFSDNYSQTKTITPILRYKGKEVNLKNSSAEIYWFKENIYINKSDNPLYCQYGGLGWECLNEKKNVVTNEDGTQSWNWNTNAPTITVDKNDFFVSIKYKCTILYNNNKISAEIKLLDPQCDASFKLYSNADDNTYIKDMGMVHVIARVWIKNITNTEAYRNSIIYSWSRYDYLNNFIKDDEQFYTIVRSNEMVHYYDDQFYFETEISFPVGYIEDTNYIHCTAVYKNSNLDKIVGTEVIKITTREDPAEYTVIINGDDLLYKYDVNGISPMESDKYHGPITSRVNYIEPLTFTILKRDGTELTNEEYAYVHCQWIVPRDSSLFTSYSTNCQLERQDNEYFYFGKFENNRKYNSIYLNYKLKSNYDKSQALKKIKLVITIPTKNITIEQFVNISFMKEGENGSNGSEYAIEIVGGSSNTNEQAPIGTFDRKGNPIQLKFLYNTVSSSYLTPFQRLYTYYTSGNQAYWAHVNIEGYLTSHNNTKLYLNVYRDGLKLSTNDYEVTWSMYDSDHCFKIYPGFENNKS
ncbi:MAG: hypothetical protein IJ880_01040, partial [Bacilli bacterium]|nr:hypothetical protein [Bacilli bacterium]